MAAESLRVLNRLRSTTPGVTFIGIGQDQTAIPMYSGYCWTTISWVGVRLARVTVGLLKAWIGTEALRFIVLNQRDCY